MRTKLRPFRFSQDGCLPAKRTTDGGGWCSETDGRTGWDAARGADREFSRFSAPGALTLLPASLQHSSFRVPPATPTTVSCQMLAASRELAVVADEADADLTLALVRRICVARDLC